MHRETPAPLPPFRDVRHSALKGGDGTSDPILVQRRNFVAAALTVAASFIAPPLADAVAVVPAAVPAGMVFPVAGPSRFGPDFGAPRSGGRTHEGNDIFGAKHQVVVAAADGRVSFVRADSSGSSGNMLTIESGDGWSYRYMHLNNDTPGTDDGANPRDHAFVPGIVAGAHVVAGQPIAFLGDSGNAEATAPHLHFEVRRPDRSALDPYAVLRAAPPVAVPQAAATAVNPEGGFYVLTTDGRVHAYGGAPALGSPTIPPGLARSMAVTPDGRGYVVLDAWGGLHRFGTAATGPLAGWRAPYWPGRDLARDIAITPSGAGLVVLDAWGGVHGRGDAPAGSGTHWWPGWDVARAVAVTPSGEGLYVLDAFGGINASGDARRDRTPYWRGWDVAREIVALDGGYAVLDSWGGLHTAGRAPRPRASTWSPGSDWTGLDVRGDRYVVTRTDGLTVTG